VTRHETNPDISLFFAMTSNQIRAIAVTQGEKTSMPYHIIIIHLAKPGLMGQRTDDKLIKY
jgi:hypothetical protein